MRNRVASIATNFGPRSGPTPLLSTHWFMSDGTPKALSNPQQTCKVNDKQSMNTQLDYLDQVAGQIARRKFYAYGPLSSGERVYAALAANRSDLLQEDGYTRVRHEVLLFSTFSSVQPIKSMTWSSRIEIL